MAITKSAKKALRQNIKRRARNIQKRRKIRDLIKKIETLVSEKNITEAKKLLPSLYKSLDKAAKKGAIKKNTASRKKSRITKLLTSKSKS